MPSPYKFSAKHEKMLELLFSLRQLEVNHQRSFSGGQPVENYIARKTALENEIVNFNEPHWTTSE